MDEKYYAHLSEDGRKQTVLAHLLCTALLCAQFAAKFGEKALGYWAGLLHDIGKFAKAFQKRLFDSGKKVDHSTAGAWESKAYLPISLCIMGHHSGLPDLGGRTDKGKPTYFGRMNKAKSGRLEPYDAWKQEVELPEAPKLEPKTALELDFLTRMLYSCLTDADFLDTEAFMSNGQVERGGGEAISVLTDKLDRYTEGWFPPSNELNTQRCAILRRCMEQGQAPQQTPGLYTLTVPTGGGKTVASLAFALHHAKTHGLERVIYVIPYTSIIEQTADQFRKILGAENVLEHHSGVTYDTQDEATPETQRMARATENWDMPVVVTTAVQFFESIYSNRSSKCRKLHNLAKSVIIFDEAQMLPIPYLRPCVSAIAQLIGHYHATAVLCTATQPALNPLFAEFLPGRPATELCPAGTCDEEVFRRVTFQKEIDRPISWETVAEMLTQLPQVLCIVNTRKSAKRLYDLLGDQEDTFHLSTLMTPTHRRAVLEVVRGRLKAGLPCRVVSTSLIEAGVDVDFPTVFREVAGLDSILQAAGRCNRERKRAAQDSVVTVFQSETAIPQQFEINAIVGQEVMNDPEVDDISSQEAITKYFEALRELKGKQDIKGILKMMKERLPFQTIAEQFKLIDNDSKTIYIPLGEGKALVQRLQAGERSRTLFRKLGQYGVSIYETEFKALADAGDILPVDSGKGEDLWVLANTALYDDQTGLSLNPEYGKGDFV